MSFEALAYVKQLDLGELESAPVRLLLYVIAENTFNDTFVCRLCQEQLGYEAGRISDRSVRRHLAALDEAGVLLRGTRRNDETGAVKGDNIRLVGFKKWYFRDHAKPRRKQQAAKLAGSAGAVENAVGSAPPTGQFGRKLPDSRSPEATGQQESGRYRSSLTSLPLLSPPNPHGGDEGEGRCAAVDGSGDNLGTSVGAAGDGAGTTTVDATPPDSIEQRVVAWLRQQGRHLRTVEHLIAPVLAERSLDRTASDPFQAFARVAKAWNDLPVPVLEAAVAAVFTERDAKVGTAQFDKAARAAKTRHDLTKMAASRDQRVASAMTADLVTLVAGTPAFAAYVAANPDAAGRPLVKLKPADAERWEAAAECGAAARSQAASASAAPTGARPAREVQS